MSINRPSLSALIERKKSDIESNIAGVNTSIPGSMLGILAKTLAGMDHSIYGYQDYIGQQINPGTATAKNLEYHAKWLCGGMGRTLATVASGNITFSGNNDAVVPFGTLLQRSDGVEYVTNAGVVIVGGVGVVSVTSRVVGQQANLQAGVVLSMISPIAGINSTVTVDVDGLAGGTDIESDEQLLARMSDYVARRPNGGSIDDYKRWAKEVAGVTRVWVMPHWQGFGNVGVYFARDNDDNVIPDAGEVAAVQSHINGLKPVKANVTVYAPLAMIQVMTIAISPDTPVVREAVENELKSLFRLRADVEDGNGSGVVLLSHIRAAVSAAAGENDNNVVFPVGNILPVAGEMVRLGAITWQAI